MEALIFIGIPGAGKSTFYAQRFFDTHLRINRDSLRTKPRENALIETCLNSEIRFVLDNTSPTIAVRAPFIDRVKAAGFRVHAYYFEPDFTESVNRNSKRIGASQVPVAAIGGIIKTLQPPSFGEGFDAIFSVWNYNDAGFKVKEWETKLSSK